MAVPTLCYIIDTGKYWVTVTNGPCVLSDTTVISSQYCDCCVTTPNAFSPNKDDKNDFFHPLIQPPCIVNNYRFSIYNRWGERVFFNTGPTAKVVIMINCNYGFKCS